MTKLAAGPPVNWESRSVGPWASCSMPSKSDSSLWFAPWWKPSDSTVIGCQIRWWKRRRDWLARRGPILKPNAISEYGARRVFVQVIEDRGREEVLDLGIPEETAE